MAGGDPRQSLRSHRRDRPGSVQLVGCSVTFQWMISRRRCRTRNKQDKIRKLAVITEKNPSRPLPPDDSSERFATIEPLCRADVTAPGIARPFARKSRVRVSQLAMDAWAAPGRVLACHGPKGSANFAQGNWSAHPFTPGSKAPVQTETFPMPSNNSVRLHYQKRIRPLGPHPAQQDPEHGVGRA